MLEGFKNSSVESVYNPMASCSACSKYFKDAGNYIVPWVMGDEGDVETDDAKTYPSYCGTWSQNAIF
jgi:hypothetical protein